MSFPKPSKDDQVRAAYANSAAQYSQMMEAEIVTPLYSKTLARAIAQVNGPVVDTSCGSGHFFQRYRHEFDSERQCVARDLSPQMVKLTQDRLGPAADVATGDMRSLEGISTSCAAAVVSFFALHHLSEQDCRAALAEWYRVLRPGGYLVLGTWEGSGQLDYGAQSDLVAFRHESSQVSDWAVSAGFEIARSSVDAVEGFEMQALYLDGIKR